MTPFFLQNKPLVAIPFAPEITPSALTFPADTSLMIGRTVDFSGGVASWEIARAGWYATVIAGGSSVGVGERYTAARITVSMPSNNNTLPPGALNVGRLDEIQFRCYDTQGDYVELGLSIMQEYKK